MGSFFLLFDVTMDISLAKFIPGKYGHTHHAHFAHVTAPNILGISIYTLRDLGDSSNLIGSLSWTMTLYSPRKAVNIKQNKIAVVNWVSCQSFIVRTF